MEREEQDMAQHLDNKRAVCMNKQNLIATAVLSDFHSNMPMKTSSVGHSSIHLTLSDLCPNQSSTHRYTQKHPSARDALLHLHALLSIIRRPAVANSVSDDRSC